MKTHKVFLNELAVVFLCLYLFSGMPVLFGQQQTGQPDSLTTISIDGVVITANRYENKIFTSGASVSSLDLKDILKLPVNQFSDLVKFIPGVYAASNDGLGLSPQVSVRGFYGGGEAEYLKVMIDGIPLNDLETGLVSWNLLPVSSMSSVEVLRGGSSSLYGDAALGGVVNLITDKLNKNFTRISFGYGSFNSYNIGLNHGGNAGRSTYELYVNNDGTDGFREHSNWKSLTFGGKVRLMTGKHSTLTFNSFNQKLKKDDPGPVTETELASDRVFSSPYFSYDGSEYNKYVLNLDYRQKVNTTTDMNLTLTYQHKNSNATNTYTQPPVIVDMFTFQPIGLYDTTFYGDSKKREITTNQADLALRLLNMNPEKGFRLTGGVDVNFGVYDNRVAEVFQGFENDFQHDYQTNDSTEFTGNGFRMDAAAYLSGEIALFDELKLIGGLRYDRIIDDFSSDVPVQDTTLDKTYEAFSPKIALNLNTGESENYKGSIYAGFSQAFKAPTIDQRTDLKQINSALFFEAGPAYQMMILQGSPYSNADLKPQRSNNFEIGTYQFYRFSEKFAAEINLSGYLINVDDEIDFDLGEFKYRNIQSSTHAGLESGINLHLFQKWESFVNVHRSDVKFTSGDNDGNYLKGVPKLSYAFGSSYSQEKGFGCGIVFNGASDIYLDDENTSKLESYAVFGIRLSYIIGFAKLRLDVDNLFDNKYNSTGYLLYGTKYFYPASGRSIRGGLVFNI